MQQTSLPAIHGYHGYFDPNDSDYFIKLIPIHRHSNPLNRNYVDNVKFDRNYGTHTYTIDIIPSTGALFGLESKSSNVWVEGKQEHGILQLYLHKDNKSQWIMPIEKAYKNVRLELQINCGVVSCCEVKNEDKQVCHEAILLEHCRHQPTNCNLAKDHPASKTADTRFWVHSDSHQFLVDIEHVSITK